VKAVEPGADTLDKREPPAREKEVSMLLRWLRGCLHRSRPFDPREQRRASLRLACHLPVECLSSAGWMPGRVLDVGEGGLRIEGPWRMRVDAEVSVRYLGSLEGEQADRVIACRVVWCQRVDQDWQVGLAFGAEGSQLARSWVIVALRRLQRGARLSDDRRHVRCPADLPAALELSRGLALDGRILDLSVGGALLETRFPVPFGAVVRLRLPGGLPGGRSLLARVVRRPHVEGGRVRTGLRFEGVEEENLRLLARFVAETVTRGRKPVAVGAGSTG
jgi:hypothetical protein